MSEQVKIYQLYGINTAMHLLRPGARWEISNREITIWEDERPRPTWEEIDDTMEKIKQFEDSINTIWTKKQIEEITGAFQSEDFEEVDEFKSKEQ
jgi:hypothetical protein